MVRIPPRAETVLFSVTSRLKDISSLLINGYRLLNSITTTTAAAAAATAAATTAAEFMNKWRYSSDLSI
jgi:hypothetical protein